MNQIKLHKYCNEKKLIDYGFKRIKYKEDINYILSIPLYMYKNIPVIEVKFIVFQTDRYIAYEIIQSGLNSIYSAFYNREYSNPNENNVLKEIKKNLNKELQSMKKSMIIAKIKEVQ